MSKTQLIFFVLVAVVAVGGAYTQGKITDRWSNEVSQRLEGFTQRLEGVPAEFGSWVSQDTPVDESQFKASHCHGRISRAYRNTTTGEVINVFLVSGKGYHVTIHSPDWCYVAAGYEMGKDPSGYRFDVPGIPQPEFLNATFKKVTATETTHLRILWSYSEDGAWSAPKLAKYSFASKPALYKIYMIREINDGSAPSIGDDPAVAFAKEFLPVVNSALFANSPDSEAAIQVVNE